MMGLDGGRLNIASCSLGGAAFALDTAKAYMNEPQAVRQRADRVPGPAVQARRHGDRAGGRAPDGAPRGARAGRQRDPQATQYCAMAKRFATDAGFEVANQALQLHGGYGYLHDYPLERIVRDLRVHQILEGTNEIMRVIIARELFRAMSERRSPVPRSRARVGRITLNRPQALHALTTDMCRLMTDALLAWRRRPGGGAGADRPRRRARLLRRRRHPHAGRERRGRRQGGASSSSSSTG